MKKVILTKEQREQLMDALISLRDTNGHFDIDIELDGVTINVRGIINADGYVEDDYYKGTGAWVETSKEVLVELTAYDEYGQEVAIDREAEREAYKFLNAA